MQYGKNKEWGNAVAPAQVPNDPESKSGHNEQFDMDGTANNITEMIYRDTNVDKTTDNISQIQMVTEQQDGGDATQRNADDEA